MTLTKDIAAKFAIAIVAVAMVLSAFAPVAKAQTTEDLQTMINDLLAQVAALQSQAGQGATSAAGVCPYTWTRDLNTGATGADVKMLQMFLNADADTRVSAEGVGSAGMETEYYGPATAAAVSKLQVKYRADILSPANLVNPTGYFGPSSRAKANALCAAAPVVDDSTDDTTDDETTDEDTEDMELSGEASLDTMTLDSASDDELEEGAEDAEIATVTFEFTDGDAEISRLDIALVGTGDEVDPWDTFETVSLWVDGDKVAEMDATDEDDYLNEDDGSLRFTGLDIVAMEDEEVEIVVAATVQSSVDGTDDGEDWTVSVDALRFFDADGVATTEDGTVGPDDFADTVAFTIDEAGSEDELIAKTSSDDLDATTLQVEDDQKSDWYTVFVFDLDTDDSINDIELNSIKVNASTTMVSYNTLVDDAELVIDGVTIDDVTVAYGDSATTSAVLTFDVDGDVMIDAGDRVAAELRLRFKSLATTTEGATIQGSVSSLTTSIVDAQGADDLANGQLGGAATGDAHTLRTTGIITASGDNSAVVTTGDTAGDDYATFEVEVEVTAFEQDVRISTNVATSVAYTIVDGAGVVVGGTSTPVLTSTADENGGYFEINEGETETITLQVTFDATTAGAAARLVFGSITFDELGTLVTTDDTTQTLLPVTDYRSDVVTLVN